MGAVEAGAVDAASVAAGFVAAVVAGAGVAELGVVEAESLVLGSGGIAGTAGGSAVRATGEDSSVAFAAAGSVMAKGPGDHGGAASPAGAGAEGVDVLGVVEAAKAGASSVAGTADGVAVAAVALPSSAPISKSGDQSLSPAGNGGSVSLIFMYRNTPTAANSVIVTNGRRELTASPPDEQLR